MRRLEVISGLQAEQIWECSTKTVGRRAKLHPEIVHSPGGGRGRQLMLYAELVRSLAVQKPVKLGRPRKRRAGAAVETAYAAE